MGQDSGITLVRETFSEKGKQFHQEKETSQPQEWSLEMEKKQEEE